MDERKQRYYDGLDPDQLRSAWLLSSLAIVLLGALGWGACATAPLKPTQPMRSLAVRTGCVDAELTVNGVAKRTPAPEFLAGFVVPDTADPVTVVYKAPGDSVGLSKAFTFAAHDGAHQVLINDCIALTAAGFQVRFDLPRPPARRGLVRADGKALFDDDGPLRGNGVSWFWALHAFKYEPERFVKTATFEAKPAYKHNFVRVFAQVDFAGVEIDPSWPDYEQQLGGMLDALYDTYGLRTKVTVVGGKGYAGAIALAHTVSRVTASRAQKVIGIEAANECMVDMQTVVAMVKILRAESGVPRISGTSPNGCDADDATLVSAGATVIERHTPRQSNDNGWENVRQPFDFKDIPSDVANSEGPGPEASTGGDVTSDLQMAMFAELGVQEGSGEFTAHTGEGVYGRKDNAHPDRANELWSAGCKDGDTKHSPGQPCAVIDAIYIAIAKAIALVPDGAENWRKTVGNLNTAPQILRPDSAWGGNDSTADSPNRSYGSYSGTQFVVSIFGIRNSAAVRLGMPGVSRCDMKAVNPATGETLTATKNVGDYWTLPGRADTMAGFVVVGSCQ